MNIMLLDPELREQQSFGDQSFPIQYDVDDFGQWPDHSVPLHWHLGPEFFSASKCNIDVCVGNQHLTLSEGQTIFINGGQMHSYRQIGNTSRALCPNIVFSKELLGPITGTIYRKYLQPVFNDPGVPYIIFDAQTLWHRKVTECLFNIYGILARYGIRGRYESGIDDFGIEKIQTQCPEICVLQELFQIFKLMYCHLDELPRVKVSDREQTSQIRLQKMLLYIQEHYTEKITLSELAACAGISRSEAGRCFKDCYHTTPMTCVIQYRLAQAIELLSDTTMTVSQISALCGFQDAGYFIKIFRRHFNKTPLEYRKEQR